MVRVSDPDYDWAPELSDVWRILNRDTEVPTLPSLHAALQATATPLGGVSPVAIGFDTGALLRLGFGSSGPDILDYLGGRHSGPLIVPGQTLQELWSNQLVATLPYAKMLQTKLSELLSEAGKLDHQFGEKGDLVKSAIDALVEEYNHTFGSPAQESLLRTLQVLRDREAIVRYVPRFHFRELARVRSETRTPPGYKDPRDTDFFVWADFLYGLRSADTDSLEGVAFVTEDFKDDWSRNGIAHPILSSEVHGIIAKPFALWSIRHLKEYVDSRA